MVNEMYLIEKIAKAICEVEFNLPGVGGLKGTLTISRGQAEHIARIAVEQMRHPSIFMVEAGCNAHPNSYGAGLHPAVYQYRTMIDAELKE